MENTLILTPLVLYLLATLFYLTRLLVDRPRLGFIGLRLLMLGGAAQLVQIVWRWFIVGQTPFATFFDFFQISALLIVMVFVSLCFFKRFYAAAPLFVVFADILYLISITYHGSGTLTGHLLGKSYFFIHLTSIFLTLVGFSVALILAILYFVSEKKLKNKELSGWMAKLPPLDVLEKGHDQSLTLAFVLLTFVIVTGAGFSKMVSGHYLSFDGKQVGALITWGYFAFLLNLRGRLNLFGHRGMLWSVAGLIALGFVYFLGF